MSDDITIHVNLWMISGRCVTAWMFKSELREWMRRAKVREPGWIEAKLSDGTPVLIRRDHISWFELPKGTEAI